MVRRTKEDAQETRTLILDTAEQVFREKGVGHTTLAEIAAAAGVTRGAIYWHFDNKAALLQAMNDRVHLPLEAMHQALADIALTDPLAKMRESAHGVLKQVAHDPRSRRVFEIFSFKCEFVGEMALLLDVPRTATVVALTEVHLLALGKESFEKATAGHLQVRRMLERDVSRRMVDLKRVVA